MIKVFVMLVAVSLSTAALADEVARPAAAAKKGSTVPLMEIGADSLVGGFLRAFNTHDAKAFGSLFTEDADWVSVAGIRVKGRADIQAEHDKAFTTFFKSAILASTGSSVRLLRADIAVVHFNWELTRENTKATPPRRGVIIIVGIKEANGWRITAGQNTNTFVPQ